MDLIEFLNNQLNEEIEFIYQESDGAPSILVADKELKVDLEIHFQRRINFYAKWCLKNSRSYSFIQYLFLENEDGKPVSRRVTFYDVSHNSLKVRIGKTQNPAELLFSDGAILELVNNIEEVILISEPEPFDPPGPRIVYVNDAFKRMTGFGDEILGKTPRELQGEETTEEARKKIRLALDKWEPIKIELLNYTKDKRPFWVELNIQPVKDETGWWTHWISIQRDVTEQVKHWNKVENQASLLLEEKDEVDDILEAAKIGFWSLDLQNNVLAWDQSMYKLYEIDPEKFAGDYEAWESTLHPDDYTKINEEIVNAISYKDRFELQFRVITQSGYQKHIKANAKIKRDKSGTPFLMKGVNIDISKEIELVNEVNTQRRQSIHRAKLATIGQLSAGVGHEINNPLTISSGSTQLIRRMIQKDNFDKEKILDYLDRQTFAHDRISDIVEGLKVYSRVDTEENTLINIQNVIDVTLKLIENIFAKDGIGFTVEIEEGEFLVHGNFGKLQQCLVNLLTNAKDASKDREEPKIILSVKKNGCNVEISVKDNGTGMSQAVKEKIFNPFFTTKPIGVGTGLGLSIVSKFVEGMKGKIIVSSEQGVGTEFIISLPLA